MQLFLQLASKNLSQIRKSPQKRSCPSNNNRFDSRQSTQIIRKVTRRRTQSSSGHPRSKPTARSPKPARQRIGPAKTHFNKMGSLPLTDNNSQLFDSTEQRKEIIIRRETPRKGESKLQQVIIITTARASPSSKFLQMRFLALQ